jgi:ferritin-like metal-binding protein YciE
MKKMKNLTDLLEHELRDLYSAENQLVKALPKLAKTATHDELRTVFETHLEETKEHVRRLEEVADEIGVTLGRQKCKGMEGLLEEGSEFIKNAADVDESVLDAGLIAQAQRAEHYEIAAYGCAATYADLLGHTNAKKLLGQTLQEERQTDEKLTRIAMTAANREAAAAG